MKNYLLSLLGLALVIFVITSGLFECITKVAIWLITLDMEAPAISIVGQIIAKYGTWAITFILVGSLFEFIGWFNSKAMAIVYAATSIVVSFVLSWVIMIIEQYLLFIVIGIIILLAISIAVLIIVRKRNKKKEEQNDL